MWSRGVETGGGGGSRLSEMPPLLSTRVCGEFSGEERERVLRRKREEEEERERERERGDLLGEADYYKAERYSAREAMLLGVGAWAPIYFSLSLYW